MSQLALFLGGTKGLGYEMAKIAVAEGMRVTVVGRTAKACPLVTEGRALALERDLSAPHPWHFPDSAYDLIVWTSGIHQQGSFLDLTFEEIGHLCRVHLQGPMAAIADLLRSNRNVRQPCHLVVVGSTSAYQARDDQAVYGALKAAKAQLARNLGRELPAAVPGSKVLLASPGGMKTPFWEGREHISLNFMDPDAVARVIWNEMQSQADPFREINIIRQPDRTPKLEVGPKTPF